MLSIYVFNLSFKRFSYIMIQTTSFVISKSIEQLSVICFHIFWNLWQNALPIGFAHIHTNMSTLSPTYCTNKSILT